MTYNPRPVGSRWRLFFPSTGEVLVVTVVPTGDRAPSGCLRVMYDDAQGYHRSAYVDIDQLTVPAGACSKETS